MPSPLTPDHILVTSGLGKRFRKRWAVKNLDLQVHRGDIFGFLGPNGAGKSTTIRMLFSLIRPTTGVVRLFGEAMKSGRNEVLRRVGGIVEKPDFYSYLSAFRNLEIVGSFYGGIAKARILEVLDLVGLGERAFDRVRTFSHGMKQRLGIAQALLQNPELIILDEPTSGLDPQGMKDVRELILHLARSKGKTIFLSSHLLSEVEMVANRMAIISKGELVVQGIVTDLLNKGEGSVVLRASPRAVVRSVLRSGKVPIQAFREQGGQFHVSMSFSHVPRLNTLLVRKGAKVEALVPRRSLEEFFLSLTESDVA